MSIRCCLVFAVSGNDLKNVQQKAFFEIRKVIAIFQLNDALDNDFVCPEDGFFPVDDQCTGDYYVCLDGEAFAQVKKNL